MNLRRILTTACTVLRVAIARIDARLNPPEKPQPEMDPQQAAEIHRRLERQVRLAGTRRWNYHRPRPREIPESMRYLEDTQGEAAVLRALVAQAQRRERGR